MLALMNQNYDIPFDHLELFRDGGSTAYVLCSGAKKYFLRVIKPAFFDTAINAVDIQVFLQTQGLPVPPVVFAKTGMPYVKTDAGLLILYDFIEGAEAVPVEDAALAGALIGQLHRAMRNYPGEQLQKDKQFYIGRYMNQLRLKQYKQADAFAEYGDMLWEKLKDLPRAYCHGDMHPGNLLKTPEGKLYLLDFDTSCRGFPMYDIALFCNQTNYFKYSKQGYEKSRVMLHRFLPAYETHCSVSTDEINAFYDLIALSHFALQATIIELYGIDCVDNKFFDKQLDWLYRWREQCEQKK